MPSDATTIQWVEKGLPPRAVVFRGTRNLLRERLLQVKRTEVAASALRQSIAKDMALAPQKIFGAPDGQQWRVSHYLMEKRS